MTNARIERLTREALGPRRRRTDTAADDVVLRAVGIVILIALMITFVTWPRQDGEGDNNAGGARSEPAQPVQPAPHSANEAKTASVRGGSYSPLY